MMELDGCVEGDSWRNELESGRVSRVERVDLGGRRIIKKKKKRGRWGVVSKI